MPAKIDPRDQQIAALMAELEAAKQAAAAAATRTLTFKVSEKGGVSVRGLGRFPVTLYGDQWDRLLHPATVDALRSFIADNRPQLATKAKG